MRKKPSYVDFQHDTYKWKSNIDYRMHPELYHIGRGQQGVLTCEPDKSELHRICTWGSPVVVGIGTIHQVKSGLRLTGVNGKYYH